MIKSIPMGSGGTQAREDDHVVTRACSELQPAPDRAARLLLLLADGCERGRAERLSIARSEVAYGVNVAPPAAGHFPNEQAAMKCLYLTARFLDPTGKARARWVTPRNRL
jgi:DNA-binding IclR family transcriptional regulator